MDLTISAPDYTMVSGRAVTLPAILLVVVAEVIGLLMAG